MQRVAGRVETAVERDGVLAGLTECVDIGGLVNEAAPLQLVNDVHGMSCLSFTKKGHALQAWSYLVCVEGV